MSDIKFFSYTVKICNNSGGGYEETRSGVVAARSFTDAMDELETYYYFSIIKVLALEITNDSVVFDFSESGKV